MSKNMSENMRDTEFASATGSRAHEPGESIHTTQGIAGLGRLFASSSRQRASSSSPSSSVAAMATRAKSVGRKQACLDALGLFACATGAVHDVSLDTVQAPETSPAERL